MASSAVKTKSACKPDTIPAPLRQLAAHPEWLSQLKDPESKRSIHKHIIDVYKGISKATHFNAKQILGYSATGLVDAFPAAGPVVGGVVTVAMMVAMTAQFGAVYYMNVDMVGLGNGVAKAAKDILVKLNKVVGTVCVKELAKDVVVQALLETVKQAAKAALARVLESIGRILGAEALQNIASNLLAEGAATGTASFLPILGQIAAGTMGVVMAYHAGQQILQGFVDAYVDAIEAFQNQLKIIGIVVKLDLVVVYYDGNILTALGDVAGALLGRNSSIKTQKFNDFIKAFAFVESKQRCAIIYNLTTREMMHQNLGWSPCASENLLKYIEYSEAHRGHDMRAVYFNGDGIDAVVKGIWGAVDIRMSGRYNDLAAAAEYADSKVRNSIVYDRTSDTIVHYQKSFNPTAHARTQLKTYAHLCFRYEHELIVSYFEGSTLTAAGDVLGWVVGRKPTIKKERHVGFAKACRVAESKYRAAIVWDPKKREIIFTKSGSAPNALVNSQLTEGLV